MKILLKIFLILPFILMNIHKIHSQVNQEWTARYFGTSTGIDGASEIITDVDGNVYVTGASYGANNKYDYLTIKYSASGGEIWIARYNGPGNDHDIANAIAIDDSNNIYITGGSIGVGTGEDIATIKYNSLGVQQWVVRYTNTGNHNDAAYAIVIDHSGSIYVTGESYGGIGLGDYITLKYNSNGIQQWTSRYIDGVAYSIAVDDSNNVYVTGRGAGDFATIKYNTFGVQKWIARYDGPMHDNDAAEKIAVDSLGNVYVSGSSVGALFYYDYTTVKYNSSGLEQWVRRYEGSAHFMDNVQDMKIDKSGNVYVTGNGTESGRGYDFTTIKYNTNGDTLWMAKFNNGPNDIAYAIALDNDGNIYVAGESDGGGTNEDYATVKYNSSGVQQWVKRYDYSGQYGDFPQAIAIDNNGNIYITGSSNRDYLTIKYSQITEINPISTEIPFKFKLSQNYPNPFNPVTDLEFGISELGFVSLKVYDVLGNEVATLVNEKKNAGRYQVEFDGSGLSSGVYFYTLSIGDFKETKRMLLLK